MEIESSPEPPKPKKKKVKVPNAFHSSYIIDINIPLQKLRINEEESDSSDVPLIKQGTSKLKTLYAKHREGSNNDEVIYLLSPF